MCFSLFFFSFLSRDFEWLQLLLLETDGPTYTLLMEEGMLDHLHVLS